MTPTICPAPTTPRLLTSRAAIAELVLNRRELPLVAALASCLVTGSIAAAAEKREPAIENAQHAMKKL